MVTVVKEKTAAKKTNTRESFVRKRGNALKQETQNELERLKTEQALITSKGLTKEILYKQFIDKWDGKTPLYGIAPDFLKITQ